MLRELGADAREVRTPAGLEGLDALVMPGGESTTMTLGIEREGLAEPLRELAAARHADPRHVRGDDHARPRAPRHRRLDVHAQRVRPPDPLVRGRPADPRRRGPAGARGVHPRAVDRRARRRRRGAGGGRRPSGRRAPGQPARARVPPGDRRRAPAARAVPCSRSAPPRDKGPPALLRPPRRVGGERLRPGGGDPARGLGQALRARLGAGALARPPARGARAGADRRQHDDPRAGDRAGHRRGARPADRDRPGPARGAPVRRVLRVIAGLRRRPPRCTGCRPRTPTTRSPAPSPSTSSSRASSACRSASPTRPRSAASSRSATTASCTSSWATRCSATTSRRSICCRSTSRATRTPASRSSSAARAA